ncbi:MAG: phage virion morphogenesis protein [Helicobacteraceae bacterium]|nr:phage virion morphogenesis protein [Helicobacteraceae bacterium]
MVKLNIEIDAGLLDAQIDRLQGWVKDGSLALEAANRIANIAGRSFARRESPDGIAWEPLLPETVAAKQKAGYPDPSRPLYGSGHMQRSLTIESAGDTATVGLNAVAGVKEYPYPASHQFGAPKRNIPARPFLPIDARGELYEGVRLQIEADLRGMIRTWLNSPL